MTEDSWSEVSHWLGFSLEELPHKVTQRDDNTKEKLNEVLDEVPETGQVDGAGNSEDLEDSDITVVIQKTKEVAVTSK